MSFGAQDRSRGPGGPAEPAAEEVSHTHSPSLCAWQHDVPHLGAVETTKTRVIARCSHATLPGRGRRPLRRASGPPTPPPTPTPTPTPMPTPPPPTPTPSEPRTPGRRAPWRAPADRGSVGARRLRSVGVIWLPVLARHPSYSRAESSVQICLRPWSCPAGLPGHLPIMKVHGSSGM